MTEIHQVTADEAIAALDAAVADRGAEYIYPQSKRMTDRGGACRYWHAEDGEPGCIVGWVMVRHFDVPPAALAGLEGESVFSIKARRILPMTAGAMNILAAAQDAQDHGDAGDGNTWGHAVKAARREQVRQINRDAQGHPDD